MRLLHFKFLFGVLLFIGVTAAPLQASTVLALSFEELAKMSPVIVEGTVVSQTARRTADGGIETLTYIRPERSYKTPLKDELVVWQAGGTFGGVTQSVPGGAFYEIGEEVLLFLEPAPALPGAYVLLGLASTKFRLVRSDDGDVAVRDTASLGFARRTEDGRIVSTSESVPSRIDLDGLRRRIIDALP